MLHIVDEPNRGNAAGVQNPLVLQGGAEGPHQQWGLCDAMSGVVKGQGDDLGGGVFKKRLNKNMHRAIIATGRGYWVYVYLFAKKDRKNIENDELIAFRGLARLYALKTDDHIDMELEADGLVEICNE